MIDNGGFESNVATVTVTVRPALAPIATVTGLVSLSVDGLGTNNPDGGVIQVSKPSIGTTVRSAYMFAASVAGNLGINYAFGDTHVAIDGSQVVWDSTTPILNSISSENTWADVTTLVKPKIDAASPGRIDFLITETLYTTLIDGEILAVIFDDPAQATSNTIVLLFGALNVSGDTFNVLLANPIDKSDQNLALDMSLGISYGYQPAGQYSVIDVNGQRLTTSAGGQDDGEPFNGALLTVGGLDDTNDNPTDPFADDSNGPRGDDELYDLRPFITNGERKISVATRNPSANDNIFFAAFNLKSTTALVGEGIVFDSLAEDALLGGMATVTASVQDHAGLPLIGRAVEFEIVDGPNAGLTGSAFTDNDGRAMFSYTSALQGTDAVVAQVSRHIRAIPNDGLGFFRKLAASNRLWRLQRKWRR